jgi:gamma-glutamyltranspeptidase/glutathione hydrolase
MRRFVLLVLLLVLPSLKALSQPAKADHAMVVSGHPLANEAGLEILKAGGNAVDAAVAVGFALAVVYPEAGNLGGGGFMICRSAKGRNIAVDFREKAPKGSSKNMYLDKAGNVTSASVEGHRASGVPGTVAGLLKVLADHGTMERAAVMAPAIRLAEKGFVVDSMLAGNLIAYRDSLTKFKATKATFYPGGKPLEAGQTFRQPDLAKTLKRISDEGEKDFYEGKTAELIAKEMDRGKGLITMEDLAAYKAVYRTPVTGKYRDYDIVSMPPPSSGGTCLIQMLNIVEQFDLKKFGWHSADATHIMTEAMKRVFADRSRYLGDPDVQTVPTRKLLSKSYARSRVEGIDMKRATASSLIQPGRLPAKEPQNTTNYVVSDRMGNVVSVTYTLNDLFGSKVMVEGAGFLLNDQMDDFSAKPGVPNLYGLTGGDANAIAPGKRPLSSMAPTVVLRKGKPVLALGARGGSKIISAVFQVIVNVLDFGMSIDDAVIAPRFHHQWLPDTLRYEAGAFPLSVITALEAKGHVLKESEEYLGAVEALAIDPKRRRLSGGADPREPGSARGY